MTDPFELLSALDAPRPLPADLRSRLEDALLVGQQPRPLDAKLAERLSGRMTDPMEALLSGLDAPRPLSPALRADVLRRLPARHATVRRLRPAVWIAAAAVSAAAAVAVVLVVGSGPESGTVTASRPSPAASPTQSPAPARAGGLSSGTGSVGQGAPLVSALPAPLAAGGSAAAPPAPTVPGGSGGAQVSSVSPDAGPLHGGMPVRLRGPGLTTARRVLFGAAAGTQLRHLKDGSISVVTPAVSSPREVAVVVFLQDGSRVTRNNGFAYVAPPRVDSITPTSGPSAGGTWVVVSGASLARTSTVSFGSTHATRIEPVSETQVRALSPPHAAGPVDVLVTTPGGSSAIRFLYLP